MKQALDSGFDRLQQLLVSLRAGDEIRAGQAAAETGLSPDVCRTVLEGLERAGLMIHRADDLFVRRTLDIMAS